MQYYRIVTLTEDDLLLVKGMPDMRRTFIDQVILLNNQDFIETIRSFRQTLDNRNALLQQGSIHKESYMIWTQQLYEKSQEIQVQRIQWLENLSKRVKALSQEYFGDSWKLPLITFSRKALSMKHSITLWRAIKAYLI